MVKSVTVANANSPDPADKLTATVNAPTRKLTAITAENAAQNAAAVRSATAVNANVSRVKLIAMACV
jgi:hypothetical protein